MFLITGCSEKKEETKKPKKEFSYFYKVDKTPKNMNIKQNLYLPVYSHVYTSENTYEPMGITLSIRNTDENHELSVEKISYYNTAGDLLEEYIDSPHILKKMASIEFIVDLRDMRGGSGANFIIKYATDENTTTPIIQAVMVNNAGNRAFSFITNAKPIK